MRKSSILLPIILMSLLVVGAKAATGSGPGSDRRMPGEFETQDGLILSAAQMVQFHPQVLADIVRACQRHIRVLCLMGDDQEEELVRSLLERSGLTSGSVSYLEAPMATMWARDWGPISVLRPDSTVVMVDPHYEVTILNQADDDAAASLSHSLDLPVDQLPLTLEGGDLLSNGRGLAISSRRVIQRNADSRGLDTAEIGRILQRHFGIDDWFPLPSLVGEPTGHVDMYATFIDSVTVVVGRYDPVVDKTNAALLDAVAKGLEGFPSAAGPLRVERIPMPSHADGRWRSYTNVVYANDCLLVPTYPRFSPELDRKALALYARLLPDWHIVGIDCSDLIRKNGALHCIVLNAPQLDADGS